MYIDTAICFAFLYDIYLRARAAENKKKFWSSWMTWIDLISSIPFGGILHAARLARVIRLVKLLRLFRLLRGIKAITPIIRWISGSKSRGVLTLYLSGLFVLIFYASLAMYTYESAVNDSINNLGDALWFSFITVSSVGYGDIYPVTGVGRIIAVTLVVSGMGLLSIVTAEFASKFMLHAKNRE